MIGLKHALDIRIFLIKELSKATGSKGLAGGQSLDLLFEKKKVNISKILRMYEMKTSSLFSFSCVAPFILANKSKKEMNFAKKYEFIAIVLSLVFAEIPHVCWQKCHPNNL